MNRRDALQRAASLMGGVLSAPILRAFGDTAIAEPSANWTPVFLTQAQIDVVGAVVDVMIPRTDTPGAKDVGVPALMDLLLKDVYPAADRERFVSDLGEFDAAAKKAFGKSFVNLDREHQSIHVQKFHDAAIAAEKRLDRPEGEPVRRPFILMTKEVALVGFFTSFPGATQVLQYQAIPGAWHACLPLSETGNGKTWASEPGIRL